MAELSETEGIVLFTRNYKEHDKLVKIFTEKYGKLMVFARGGNRANYALKSAILPMTFAEYVGTFKKDSFSFITATKEVNTFKKLQQDIFLNAYATYMLNLADVAINDHEYDPFLYTFLKQGLEKIDSGFDAEIICNIYEIQILARFGIVLNWDQCAICGETHGEFDYSSKYSGIICHRHFVTEPRYHADKKAVYMVRMLAKVHYDQLDNIKVKPQTKHEIRKFIDELYEEYVGTNLKSKKFIDQMSSWADKLIVNNDKDGN